MSALDLPRTNKYGLASAQDRAYHCLRPRSIGVWWPRWTVLSTAPDGLKHAPDEFRALEQCREFVQFLK
jgi:hypothetical protein